MKQSPSAPCSEKNWTRVLKQDGKPVLSFSILRPAFPETGKTERVERYFARLAEQWERRWTDVLFPRACRAAADAVSSSRPFDPWQAKLTYTVTLWEPPLLSLRLDAEEQTGGSRPLLVCQGETWDLGSGYPRPLRSFFPARSRRWRKELLAALARQAQERLASGESLLDPDCPTLLARTFDPECFYLTGEGLAVFYPLYLLGPFAEGISVFHVPLGEAE